MDRYVLARPVTITGSSFWGLPADVHVKPVPMKGWFWDLGMEFVPITPDLLRQKRNRVCLHSQGKTLEVFEHFGALRFLGLDSIAISSRSCRLPYDGSAKIFYDALTPYVRKEGKLEHYCIKEERIASTEVKKEGELPRFVSYRNEGGDVSLKVRAMIRYESPSAGLLIGPYTEAWSFPTDHFRELAHARTQGWPPSRQRLAYIMRAFGWPHYDRVSWPRGRYPRSVAEEFVRHRILDILGSFSVLCPPAGMLTGTIVSSCGGHQHDVELVQRVHAEKLLKPVERTVPAHEEANV